MHWLSKLVNDKHNLVSKAQLEETVHENDRFQIYSQCIDDQVVHRSYQLIGVILVLPMHYSLVLFCFLLRLQGCPTRNEAVL